MKQILRKIRNVVGAGMFVATSAYAADKAPVVKEVKTPTEYAEVMGIPKEALADVVLPEGAKTIDDMVGQASITVFDNNSNNKNEISVRQAMQLLAGPKKAMEDYEWAIQMGSSAPVKFVYKDGKFHIGTSAIAEDSIKKIETNADGFVVQTGKPLMTVAGGPQPLTLNYNDIKKAGLESVFLNSANISQESKVKTPINPTQWSSMYFTFNPYLHFFGEPRMVAVVQPNNPVLAGSHKNADEEVMYELGPAFKKNPELYTKVMKILRSKRGGDDSSDSSAIAFDSRRVGIGHESAQSILTIPKYNRFKVKTGEKTLVDTVQSPELNADGRILLPKGFYMSGEGKAVYVFGDNSFGAQASLKPLGFKKGQLAAALGAGALVQNAENSGALLYGASGELIYSPSGVEVALLGNYLSGNATSNGNTQDASLVQGALRFREAIGSKINLEQALAYTKNTQFGNSTEHGDVDVKVVYNPFSNGTLKHLGAYAGAGVGKQLGESTVKESDVRGKLGIEYR